MNHKHNENSPQSLAGKTRNLSLVLCLGLLAGVLIWAKLRLVTDIPRSAYADPREVMVPDEHLDQQPDQQDEQSIKINEEEIEPSAESSSESIIDSDHDQPSKP